MAVYAGNVYLDHAGATLYAKSQLESSFQELQTGLFGNPHSAHMAAAAGGESTNTKIDHVRKQIMDFFGASEQDYALVLTSGATAGLKSVGECFPWSEGSTFAHSFDSHSSVLGIRGYAGKNDAAIKCVSRDQMKRLEDEDSMARVDHVSGDAPASLFAYPAECNFSGATHSLSLVEKIRNGAMETDSTRKNRWFVLLDAAKFVGTHQLDLSAVQPDFVVMSFYKMFGYPTGMGALLIKKTALPMLEKRYYGGGTIQSILANRNFAIPRLNDDQGGATRFMDGTQSFLSILSLRHGLDQLKRLSMKCIEAHTKALRELLLSQLTSLTHWNNQPICRIYGGGSTGSIVALNFLRADGSYVGYAEVSKLAEIHNIHLRTGCFCNPGACQEYLGLKESDLLAGIEAGHVCGDHIDLVNGLPTGAVRLSVGYMTTYEDIIAFIDFTIKYFVSRATLRAANDQVARFKPSSSVFLRKISLFPIKSCAGMSVASWPVGSRGLLFDREWAIADSCTGKTLSQKDLPELCLIEPVVDMKLQTLTIMHRKTNDSFVLPLYGDLAVQKTLPDGGNVRDLKVCSGACKGRVVGEEVSEWLSACLGWRCCLVRVSANDLRPSRATEPKHSQIQQGRQDPSAAVARSSKSEAKIGFANQAQYLLISKQSINNFNEALLSVDPMFETDEDAFRANLIVDGCDAFEEDAWQQLRIGEVCFEVSGPCSRCSMINIDQKTGTFNRTPLQVLSGYRRKHAAINFGQFLTRDPSNSGIHWLHTQAPIEVTFRRC